MITRTVKGIVFLAGLLVIAYGYFLVPLGDRTLYEHTVRIAATDEAQELGEELGEATDELEAEIRSQLQPDAGADAAPAP
ncbi:MAG: hypothetical protein AAGF12_19910 [Myxococcota bacterium]